MRPRRRVCEPNLNRACNMQRQDFFMIVGSEVITFFFSHTKFQEFIKLFLHAGIAEHYRLITNHSSGSSDE